MFSTYVVGRASSLTSRDEDTTSVLFFLQLAERTHTICSELSRKTPVGYEVPKATSLFIRLVARERFNARGRSSRREHATDVGDIHSAEHGAVQLRVRVGAGPRPATRR